MVGTRTVSPALAISIYSQQEYLGQFSNKRAAPGGKLQHHSIRRRTTGGVFLPGNLLSNVEDRRTEAFDIDTDPFQKLLFLNLFGPQMTEIFYDIPRNHLQFGNDLPIEKLFCNKFGICSVMKSNEFSTIFIPQSH